VKEPAIPSDIIFTATTQDECAIQPSRQLRNGRLVRHWPRQPIVCEQLVGNLRRHCVGVISRGIGQSRFAGHDDARSETYGTDRRRPHKGATGKASTGQVGFDW
jgi:hypothetical protein